MSPLLRRVFSWLVVLTALAFATTARADNREREESAALKKLGDSAMDKLRYEEALKYYADAYAHFADPAILYNRGRVYGARGEYPLALADLEQFSRDASPELRAKVPALAALIAEMASHVTTITITCDQPGARVLVRDTLVGTTPLAPLRVSAGKADIEAQKEGFQTLHLVQDLVGGKAMTIPIVLVAIETQGVLAVSTKGTAARVAIDGKATGTAPVEARLVGGQHKVSLRADGYEDIDTTAVVRAGERRDLAVDMKKKPGLVTRWWFWTGIGVVVATAVVVTYAAVTEKSPSNGDHFAPSQVRAPLTIAAW